MLDPQSAATVAETIRRESRSLLSYMADAVPWTTAKAEPALTALGEAVAASSAAIVALGKFLAKQRITPPVLGAYPTYFTSCNFVALDWLLPRLLSSEKESLARLEADAKKIPSASAKEQLAEMAGVKRATIARLEALSAKPAAA